MGRSSRVLISAGVCKRRHTLSKAAFPWTKVWPGMALSPTRVVHAEFVAGGVDAEGLPAPTLLEIAFAGRSHVGKSSLLHAMMQRKSLARTSNTPGCTRQLNVYEVRCSDELSLRFVDLPGYGWAKRSKKERSEWQAMIEGYLQQRAGLRAVAV